MLTLGLVNWKLVYWIGAILFILDDARREIPLDIIGSFGDGDFSRGCKILLTSREENKCLCSNCKHPVNITILTVNEAWDLFSNVVGICQIHESLAQKMCNKCARLPLLIMQLVKHYNSSLTIFMKGCTWSTWGGQS